MIGARGHWRRIEQALAGELPAAARRRLWVELRGDPVARGRYDAAVLALRLLEGDAPIAQAELDLVERWVVEDLPTAAVPARARSGWGTLTVAFALAAATILALVLRPKPPAEGDEAWVVRGLGRESALAIEAVCGDATAPASALTPRTCAADDVLGFAYRVEPGARGRYLTLFGVDADGDAMFYAPTPAEQPAVDVTVGGWQAVNTGVRLDVNHAPGPLDVYGVLAPMPASTEQIRDWVQRLRATEAGPSPIPWPRRIGLPTLDGLCNTPDACDVAQLRVTVGNASP
jgi:hypothetical protein